MKTQDIDAQNKLSSIAHSIHIAPQIWAGWSALHIETINTTPDDFQDIRLSTKAIIESYLQDTEGTAYFCDDKHIFLICKNIPASILEQVLDQIIDMSFGSYKHPKHHTFHCLFESSEAFLENIQDCPGILPVNTPEKTLEKTPEKTTAEPPKSEHLRVLLVEDDPVTRWIVRNAVKDECDFAAAGSAEKVFSLYESYRPSIVFLDIGLPGKSGHEALQWIIEHDPQACVIMMSSQANLETMPRCIEMGAKGFIPKPFVKTQLIEYIQKYG